MDISAIECHIKKVLLFIIFVASPCRAAEPSCAPNKTHQHLNKRWLEPDALVHPAVHSLNKRLSTKYGPSVALQTLLLPTLRVTRQRRPYFIPTWVNLIACFAHSIRHVNRVLPTGGRKGSWTVPQPARLAPRWCNLGMRDQRTAVEMKGSRGQVARYRNTLAQQWRSITHKTLRWHTSADRGVALQCSTHHGLISLNYAIDLYQQHVKDNA